MYSIDAFRRDIDELYQQAPREMHLGWFTRSTMSFMKLPADWHQVRNQAIRDVDRSRKLTMHVLDVIDPLLRTEERDGTSVISNERIFEIANLANVAPRDVEGVIELQRQFSNPEWRTNLFATISKGRRARLYATLMAFSLVLVVGACVAFLWWAMRPLLCSTSN